MGFIFEARSSDSSYLETVTRGRTAGYGSTIRPAESHWHIVLARHQGGTQALVVGPWSASGVVDFSEGAELLWIKFSLGTFMPHRPTKDFRNMEAVLPGAASNSFWLYGSAWQFPGFDNAETFINRLVRAGALVRDPAVNEALLGRPPDVAPRTLRHRFLRATGFSQSRIQQFQRAQRAEALLKQGCSILDTVHAAGYFDQPHLTRSLKQFIGRTPAEITRLSRPRCRSVQDNLQSPGYDTNVLTQTRQSISLEV